MGRGKRRLLFRELPLADGERHRPLPPALEAALLETAGEARVPRSLGRLGRFPPDAVCQVYPEGQRRYVGYAVATKAWAAEAHNRDRPRILHGRGVIDGEIVSLRPAGGSSQDEHAQVRIIGYGGDQAEVVHRTRGVIGTLLMQDAKVSCTVFRGEELVGVVKSQGKRGQRQRLDLRLAGVAAYFFLLEP